jgi:hypothetical protein
MRYLAYTWNLPNPPRSRGGRCLHPPALSGPSQGSQAPDLQGPAGDARLSSAGPILPSLPWIGLNMPSHSRDAWRPKFCISLALLKRRGRGEDRVRAAPAVSQAIVQQRMLHMSIQVQRRTPGLPCAMALRLIRVRPGDRLSCHHHRQRLSPRHNLTPAPGRQAHTISPYACAALVSRSLRVHRIPPHGRDDRDRPSCRGRQAILNA